MERSEYERLREQEVSYWWHVGRRDIIRSLLERHVPRDATRVGVDLGCGTGSHFELLAPWGRFVGTEVTSELYGVGDPPGRPVCLARGEALPFADASVGLCTLFDVLEHIESEDAALTEIRRVLRPQGLVLLSVPAYMFLWSSHDESLHHYRRYVARTLRDALERNGLEVIRLTYAMASILPPVALVRWATRNRQGTADAQASYVPTPEPFHSMLTGLLGLEARWLRVGNFPFGTSLFALARKVDA